MVVFSARGCGAAVLFCAVAWGQGRGDRPAVEFGNRIRPHSWIREPRATAGPNGFFPGDIAAAYGIMPGMGGGAGVTIAIIDAFDSPNAEADLATFSTQFGLPQCTSATRCFRKVNETGGAALPPRDTGWEVEINLDVQWVHAMAPNAHILLVEARSFQSNDLLAAVGYAKKHASVVAMSWGSPEGPVEMEFDSVFQQPGVTFLASTGDGGGQVLWPAASPYVIAVGGTNLGAADGHLAMPVSETAWSGTGGGCSAYEPQPVMQKGFVPAGCTGRGVPDVSMDGGNPSAVAVYISLQGGWYSIYGTSLAVQIYAGFVGIVNGMRGRPHLSSALEDLYAAAAGAPASSLYLSEFRDVTSGSAGSFAAGPGWDFTSGLGSPLGGSLAPFLMSKQ